MFDNPFFRYAGYNNQRGLDPVEVSVANTTDQRQLVPLFNAQDNLVADNQGLPDGVLVNQSAIYEMESLETFNCFQPGAGFRPDTSFSLNLNKGTQPPKIFRYFFSITEFGMDPRFVAEKIIAAGYSGVEDGRFYKTEKNIPVGVDATGEGGPVGSGQYRFVFGVPNFGALQGGDIVSMEVRNTTTYPCNDSKTLVQTQTGFTQQSNPNAATYKEILQTSNFRPYQVESILVQSNELAQIAESSFVVTNKNALGNRDERQLPLVNTPYLRPNQRIIQDLNKIDGATEISLELPPQTEVQLYIYEKNPLLG